MNTEINRYKTRLSRIALIKPSQTLIFNDRLKITYKQSKTFGIIWTLCKTLRDDQKYAKLGGIPPEDFVRILSTRGLNVSKETLSTLWYDRVLFKRHHRNIFSLYDVTDVKGRVNISGNFLSDIFQVIFGKMNPPENSGYHKNTKLYSVLGEVEQIQLLDTLEEAWASGYDNKGVSDISRHRTSRGEIGFLNWKYNLNIDVNGGAHSFVEVSMVNLSQHPISSYMLPIWADSQIKTPEAYSKSGQKLPIEVTMNTKGNKDILEFILSFPSPIMPGEILDFHYSSVVPKCYALGTDYFEWYFDQPQSTFILDIKVSGNQVISRPVVFEDQTEEIIQAERISNKQIRWTKYFPTMGSTYRIDFVLEKRKE